MDEGNEQKGKEIQTSHLHFDKNNHDDGVDLETSGCCKSPRNQ
jgi:hypothetical protein